MLSLKLAWRNLFRNTRRTLLTCILVSSALIVLILVDGLTLGMVNVMVGSLTHTLEGEAQINRKGFRDNYETELVIESPAEVQAALAAADEVAGFAPRAIVGGMIASPYNTTGGLVYGVDAAAEVGVSRIREAIYEGDYLTGARRELLLGKLMAELLEVKLGDRIIITAAEANTGEITQELFRATGFLEFGPEELDENLAFINLADAQALLGLDNDIHQIAIRFKNPEDANLPGLPILTRLNQGGNEALGWLALQPSLGAIIEMTNYSTAIVGAILFVLTSLGVINSMFMSIYERIYEFGVVKSMGTRPRQVLQLVLFEALFLALLACAAGIALGFLASSWFAAFGLPIGEMEFSGVVLDGRVKVMVAAYQFVNFPVYVILLTVAAAIYPGVFAARIAPTRALQRTL
ncbi:MAG: ABC transporter permease [Pseudomonadales bacterium]